MGNSTPHKVLIACEVIPEFLAFFERAEILYSYRPCVDSIDLSEVLSKEIFHGLIIRSKLIINSAVLDTAKDLKFIGRIGSGLENIDLDSCKSKGINVYRSPEANAPAVAEHALAMLLALLNRLRTGQNMVSSWKWDREGNRGFSLSKKTVGLIGYGHTGKAFHKLLECLGCQVLAYDPYLEQSGILCPQEKIFKEADIISFHVPLNAKTRHYFDSSFVDKMYKPFYLLNTSRGPIVNTKSIIKGLENGRILGAGIDVFEEERKDISENYFKLVQRLASFEDVILSPHVAGWNDVSKLALHEILFNKIVENEYRR